MVETKPVTLTLGAVVSTVMPSDAESSALPYPVMARTFTKYVWSGSRATESWAWPSEPAQKTGLQSIILSVSFYVVLSC